MDRESIKQRLMRFGKPRPDILSQHWQQTSQDEQQPDTAMARERSGENGQVAHWPTLPKWPPLPEGGPPASRAFRNGSPMAPGETPATDQQLAPPWEQPDAGQPKRPIRALNLLWRRFWPASRRLQLAIPAAGGAVLICLLLSLAVLGGAFRAHAPDTGNVTPVTGRSGNQIVPTAAGQTTPTAPATGTPTAHPTPASSFTITFTCASATIGGRGTVCVHTQPNATVSLAVRYCDGSYAGGKGLHGTAHADGSGNYTWRWNVTTGCVGAATATVSAKSAGQTITQSTTFIVTR